MQNENDQPHENWNLKLILKILVFAETNRFDEQFGIFVINSQYQWHFYPFSNNSKLIKLNTFHLPMLSILLLLL